MDDEFPNGARVPHQAASPWDQSQKQMDDFIDKQKKFLRSDGAVLAGKLGGPEAEKNTKIYVDDLEKGHYFDATVDALRAEAAIAAQQCSRFDTTIDKVTNAIPLTAIIKSAVKTPSR